MSKNIQLNKFLLKLLKNGNEKAFKEIFKYYYDIILAFVYKLTKNSSEAEDIVQETFIKLWSYKESINVDNPIKSFLYKISYNISINL